MCVPAGTAWPCVVMTDLHDDRHGQFAESDCEFSHRQSFDEPFLRPAGGPNRLLPLFEIVPRVDNNGSPFIVFASHG